MVTGELKNKIDGMWDIFWSSGMTNPLTVIEQLTYLMFIKILDDNETRKTTITGMRWDEDEWTVLYSLEDGNTVMLDNSSDDEVVVNERRDIDINKEQSDIEYVQEYRVINMNKEPAAYKVEIVLGDYDLTVSDGRVFLVRKQ
jgi:hypothetical protein